MLTILPLYFAERQLSKIAASHLVTIMLFARASLLSSFSVTVVAAQEAIPENNALAAGLVMVFAGRLGGLAVILIGRLGDV